MAVSYQLVIDCASPETLARFWAEALHYVVAPPPDGFDSWDTFYRSIGVPEEELGIGDDRIVDPHGEGPQIWFPVVPEKKSVKNRLHIDWVPDERTRDEEVDRLTALGAKLFEDHRTPDGKGWVTMQDPEGNEFCVERSTLERSGAQVTD